MDNVLVIFPTDWDRKQLESCRASWSGRYGVLYSEPSSEDCPWDFDVVDHIEATARRYRGTIAGVLSSSDYPGATAAAAIATRLRLPGSDPAAVLRCSHKFYSRVAQRVAVPDATPRFDLVDPEDVKAPSTGFPCFIKPVKGAYSVLTRRVDSLDMLRRSLGTAAVSEFTTSYMKRFNELLARFGGDAPVGGRFFLAEELLYGTQVTVEGFVCRGEMSVIGVVDSILHPGTNSFARFDYPSILPAEVQERMKNVAARAIGGIGLDDTLFNIEMIYHPADERLFIVEINPRMCGQFGDLYGKVDGRSSYVAALDIATGGRPASPAPGSGSFRMASSIPLRVYEPVRAMEVPTVERIERVRADHPGTLIWNEIQAGDELAEFDRLEDGFSCRYGVINLGADNREQLWKKFQQIYSALGYRFEPIRSA